MNTSQCNPIHSRRYGAGDRCTTRTRGILVRTLAVLAIVLTLGLMRPALVDAHAIVESSEPRSSEVVSSVPDQILVRFTEHVDDSYSRLQLFDANGNEVGGTELTRGEDNYTLVLKLPGDLPHGTYSVLWRTLSEDDGHTSQGYFAFTIGSDADVATVTVPTSALSAGDAPQWAKTTTRWLALIGLAMLMAIWPIWNLVIRPALAPLWRDAPYAVHRVHRFAVIAAIAAVLGTIAAVVVQALTLDEGNLLDRILNTLGQTRYGHLALLRLGLFLVLGLILSTCAWWFRNRRHVEGALAWVATLALPLPFALIAHAYAQPAGRDFAVAADYLHVVGFGVWGGGLPMLLFVLLPIVRRAEPEQRRAVLRVALPRFSTLALISWLVLGLTGLYAGWLQVGNLTALRETDYGKALIVKLVFLLVVLILAAYNLLEISRKIRMGSEAIWTRRLRWTLAGEIVFLLAAMLAVGQLTSLQPARDQIVEQSQQITVPFDLDGTSARLLIGPGITGVNHFRLEVGGPALDTDVEMLLRLTLEDRADLGTKEITLSRVAGNAFEHHGSELSISGTWDFRLIERISGKAPLDAEATLEIGDTRPTPDVPGNPWRFETLGGTTGLLLVVFGLAGLVLAWFAGRGPMRKESAGLAVAALAMGVILLFQARIDPILANSRGGVSAIDPTDLAMIQRGEDIYTKYCLACHGAELRGDGPSAAGMQPPPADFWAAHTKVHSDADLVYWVKNGKQGTAMPPFQGTLDDQQILDVLSFIRSEQDGQNTDIAVPEPATCTIAPMTQQELTAAIESAGNPAPDPVVASDPAVDAETQSAVMQVTEEFIACTNAGDTMRRLSLLSDRQLAASFPDGVDEAFASAAQETPSALPEAQRIGIQGTPRTAQLSDGRVMVVFDVSDPAETLGTGQRASVTMILVKGDDGTWQIDTIS